MPVYWWEAGAIWGGLVDYAAYTGDESYVATTSQALMAQIGTNADYIVESKKGQEGNDDQAFWALSVMSAAEQGFSQPSGKPLWAQIATNAFNNLITRWNTESCNGGFKWQIYPENSYGYNYRNSISNGGVFQLAARLAKHTNNATYVQWAEKIWDWTVAVGFINDNGDVYDGADDRQNCTDIDQHTWSYNTAIWLYGAATMYAQTGEEAWKDRTNLLLKGAAKFFDNYDNATNIATELVCEGFDKCNTDQLSFKAYLMRWLAKTSVVAPFTKATIDKYVQASAKGAATACNGNTCGTKWYVGGYDSNTGIGQQLSAMEAIQALLVNKAGSYQGSSSSSSAAPSSSVVPDSSSVPAVISSIVSTPAPTATPVPTSILSPVASSAASNYPGVFPEVGPSSASFCTLNVETVTVTVEEPTPTPSSSFCTVEVVTSTLYVSPSSSSAVPPAPPASSTSLSPASSGPAASSIVTPTSLSTTVYTSLIYETGTPTSVLPTGGLPTTLPSTSATTSTPAQFSGSAASKNNQPAMRALGAMGAIVGVAALF